MHVSERRACAALGQHRSTQRKVPRGREDEERLTADTIALARQYSRYGYRKIAGLLEQAGWLVNDKRVERIWRREGLKVPHKQPKRGRLWLSDGSCIRLRPEHRNHVWSYDFVEDRTHDGRKYRMLNVIDEFTHECLAIRVARKLKAIDVIDVLSDLFILRGVPGHIRSDNGPEFVAKAVQEWITAVGAKTAYITLGSPWENGYVESFNARLRDELLDGEIFYTLREAQIVIESWRRHFNTRSLKNCAVPRGFADTSWSPCAEFGNGGAIPASCLSFAVCPNRASVNALRFRNLEGSGTHWQPPADQIVSDRKDARGFTA